MPVTVCAERWLSSSCLCWGQPAGRAGSAVELGLELWAQVAADDIKGVHLREEGKVLEGSLGPPNFQ